MHVYITLCGIAASAFFSFRWWTGNIRRNHFELMQSHHSSSIYTSTYHKFCKTTKKHPPTILGCLNIHRSKNETHAYKENLLYVHTLRNKMPLAYRSNMTTPPRNTPFITKFIQTSNLNSNIVFYFPSEHSRFIA